jgi:hypothetical protein
VFWYVLGIVLANRWQRLSAPTDASARLILEGRTEFASPDPAFDIRARPVRLHHNASRHHAIGLISLDAAEVGQRIAVVAWHSWPGMVLLYGAFSIHFLNALWAVYEMRTFRMAPAKLLRRRARVSALRRLWSG